MYVDLQDIPQGQGLRLCILLVRRPIRISASKGDSKVYIRVHVPRVCFQQKPTSQEVLEQIAAVCQSARRRSTILHHCHHYYPQSVSASTRSYHDSAMQNSQEQTRRNAQRQKILSSPHSHHSIDDHHQDSHLRERQHLDETMN